MTTEWSHLPNAKHIDRVLDSVRTHPKEWAKSWSDTKCGPHIVPAWRAAYDASGKVVPSSVSYAAYDVNIDIRYHEAKSAARGVIMALIAYDDSAHLLDSSPEEIRLLIALGHPYAILFLAAAPNSR